MININDNTTNIVSKRPNKIKCSMPNIPLVNASLAVGSRVSESNPRVSCCCSKVTAVL